MWSIHTAMPIAIRATPIRHRLYQSGNMAGRTPVSCKSVAGTSRIIAPKATSTSQNTRAPTAQDAYQQEDEQPSDPNQQECCGCGVALCWRGFEEERARVDGWRSDIHYHQQQRRKAGKRPRASLAIDARGAAPVCPS